MMLPQQQAALFFLIAVAGCRPSAPQPMVTTISPTVVLETVSDISMFLLGHPAATALSPDGSRFVSLVSTAKGDEMVIWDTQSGSIVSQWELPLHNRISPMKRDLLCSTDARIICCQGSEIVVWDAQSQQETMRLEEGLVALSWDGQRIATLNEQARGDVVFAVSGRKIDPEYRIECRVRFCTC